MKKYIAPVSFLLIICQSFTIQSNDERPAGIQMSGQADTNETMTIVVGNDFFRIDENDSSLSVRIGNRD